MPRFAILTRLFRICGRAVARRTGLRACGTVVALAALSFAAAARPSCAQDIMIMRNSPQEKKKPVDMILRSIGVVEWTGPAGHPTASRLIPIAVYTNDEFLDGGAYLAQPVPLAVQKGTQYVLQTSGVPQGTYDIDEAQKSGGIWRGIGDWTPGRRTPVSAGGAKSEGSNPSRPVLHLRSIDPDRPRMMYGRPPVSERANPMDAQLTSKSANRKQIVAISDSSTANSLSLAFEWKNAADASAMQAKTETIAETDLENSPQSPSAPVDSAGANKKIVLTPTDFRCFSLHAEPKPAEETPTCVFSAENRQKSGLMRYITLIVQPDIYGTPHALSYAVAEDGKFDARPRARLVDAVNATGTQDADLLVELDGDADRRFGLYRVNKDQLQLVYVTGKLPF
jgi:hypothetical protein